ncbi:MAG: septum formation protein Maf [Rhodospirillales bacterium]|nr:septum formation protein Maf [Rhodospirillales bacterium]MBO6787624.1 septum formation protein Maf [Rhodospirillales bacterium]
MTAGRVVLASKSPARRAVLTNAGIPFSWRDARIDEDRIKAKPRGPGWAAGDLALELAVSKAKTVSNQGSPDDLVVGCDQLLSLDGELFDKPENLTAARGHLKKFSGRTHQLISAVCLVQANETVWSHVATAQMHVRDLSDRFIDTYLENEGERVLSSVGAYLLESTGAQLFERIDGDYFTVLGLPLLPLLEELRKRGILPA